MPLLGLPFRRGDLADIQGLPWEQPKWPTLYVRGNLMGTLKKVGDSPTIFWEILTPRSVFRMPCKIQSGQCHQVLGVLSACRQKSLSDCSLPWAGKNWGVSLPMASYGCLVVSTYPSENIFLFILVADEFSLCPLRWNDPEVTGYRSPVWIRNQVGEQSPLGDPWMDPVAISSLRSLAKGLVRKVWGYLFNGSRKNYVPVNTSIFPIRNGQVPIRKASAVRRIAKTGRRGSRLLWLRPSQQVVNV